MTKAKAKALSKKKPTASSRLNAMEEILMEMNNKIIALAGIIDDNKAGSLDLFDKLDQKVISIAKRVNATVSATDSAASVEKIIQQNTVKELEDLVKTLLENKVIINDGEGSVVEQSFVIGRHITSEGDEITPRLQFYVGSLAEEEKLKFIGKKVGDLVLSDDDSVSIEITELFLVKNPNQPVETVETTEVPLESSKKEDSTEENKSL